MSEAARSEVLAWGRYDEAITHAAESLREVLELTGAWNRRGVVLWVAQRSTTGSFTSNVLIPGAVIGEIATLEDVECYSAQGRRMALALWNNVDVVSSAQHLQLHPEAATTDPPLYPGGVVADDICAGPAGLPPSVSEVFACRWHYRMGHASPAQVRRILRVSQNSWMEAAFRQAFFAS